MQNILSYATDVLLAQALPNAHLDTFFDFSLYSGSLSVSLSLSLLASPPLVLSLSAVSLSNEKKAAHTDRASLSLFSPSERNKEGRLSGRGWVGVAFIIFLLSNS